MKLEAYYQRGQVVAGRRIGHVHGPDAVTGEVLYEWGGVWVDELTLGPIDRCHAEGMEYDVDASGTIRPVDEYGRVLAIDTDKTGLVIHASTPARAERERADKTRPMRRELVEALERAPRFARIGARR